MDLTLPQRLYLLIFDLDKEKLDSETALVRGQLMRGAAVAELTIAGLIGDQGGKAVQSPSASPPGDPFLAEVFDDASPNARRSLFKLVDRNWHKAEKTVCDQLEEAGALTVDRGRVLGVFPTRRIAIADPGPVQDLREQARDAALSGRDPASFPVEVAVLAALAVDGDVTCTVSRKERRAHKPAITALRAHVETALPGLLKAVGLSMTARRAGAA